MTAAELIDLLRLEPLPEEGGFFRQMYRSPEQIAVDALPARYTHEMAFGTAIYALFTVDNFSAMHRLNSDEIYHFYYGDPLEILLLNPDGSGETRLLGTDFAAGMQPQTVVNRDVWQGSRVAPGGEFGYSLIGTTMTPGYEDDGFELGDHEVLVAEFPAFASAIERRVR